MGIRFIIIALAALFIVTAVGGAIYSAKSYVEGLNEQITAQQEQIAGLEIDKEKLEISNKSLVAENNRKAEESREAREEITRLRNVDIESQKRLNKIEAKLRSQKEIKRRNVIRNSRKAGLLIKLMNRATRCYIENFERVDGKCIRGKFVETGKRLVPEVPKGEGNAK